MKKDRYQELFERSTDANLIIIENKFIDCNTATIKMLGYTNKQELLNTHPSQLSPEKQPDGQLSYIKANEMMAIAHKKGSHRFEWDHMRADGEVFPVEVLLTSIPDHKENTLHVVWRDITERKKTNDALKESRDQLEAIFDSANDGILVADAQTKQFLTGNRTICTMLGYTIEEIIKLTVNNIHPAKDLPHVIDQFEKHARKEIELATDIPVLKKDGTVLYADINMSLVTINGKKCAIGLFRDVTERRHIEKMARHSQKLEAIGTLAGGIAHDFNNILFAILGNTELAITKLPQNSEVHSYLKDATRALDRAKGLIEQILTFSNHSTSNYVPLQIQAPVKEVLELLYSTLPTTIEIKQEIANNCGNVLADATQIHQVVMNLCTNAFHAMEEKGGLLNVILHEIEFSDTEQPPVHDLAPGRYLKLEISDTGAGIKDEIMAHIFDPYYTTKPQGKGSGLGLAVVYGIVQDHGGTIKVESQVDHGTTFTVIFPLIDNNGIQSDLSAEIQSQAPRGNERILFVDDEESIAVVGKALLETLGYTVRCETDSSAVLEEFKNNPQDYDLVITDQTMPYLPGSELSKELMKIRSDIPIILCTGFSSMISEHKAKILGIKAFVMKPIDRLKLAWTIRKVLDENN